MAKKETVSKKEHVTFVLFGGTGDLTRRKLVSDINITEKKIEKTNFEIQGLSSDINSKQYSISNNLEAISLGIKQTSELENNTLIEHILSSDDFSSMWRDIDNLISIREKIRNTTTQLRQVKTELEDTRQGTIDAKNELLQLKSKLADQKKIVEQNANEKKKLLAQTKNSEASYQKVLVDRLAQKEALEQEIEDYESIKQTLEQIGTIETDGKFVFRKLGTLNVKYQELKGGK